VIRIRRIAVIINKTNADEETKGIYRCGNLFFYLILYLHMIASFWYAICTRTTWWIAPLDFVYAGQYPTIYRAWTVDYNDWYRYYVFLYNAVLFLGGNEMGPRSELELFTCTLILIVCSIFNATLFGEMTVITSLAGKKQAGFQEEIDIANTAMKSMDIPS